ncbi:MAG: TadE/TadG family type IV pilus assembly protein [Candidatus Acidiferrales bacterium]
MNIRPIKRFVPSKVVLHRSVRILSDSSGAQLIEFALVLPMLLVLLVGISDFGFGFALKDKLTEAAREALRTAISQPNDLSSTQCHGGPCSVQSAASVAVNYLSNAGVNVCGMNPSGAGPSASGFVWTYTASSGCPSAMTLKIERAVTFTSSTNNVTGTRVTISYPYSWNIGHVIKLLLPSSGYAGTITLTSAELMSNLD